MTKAWKTMITVSIVEDDDEIRESLALIIGGTPGFSCTSIYEDGETALANIANDVPDVVLMDIELPGISGIDCVKKMKAILPETDIIMLTIHDSDEVVFESLCAGACGYLTKNTQPAKLLSAIEEIHTGGAPMSTNIARMVVGSFKQHDNASLTQREKEVLLLLCKGKSYKMIADQLCISADTVRSHIKNVYKKLEVTSNAEAVAKALKENLVRP